MFDFFKKGTKQNNIYSPASGSIVPLCDVEDPVFSKKVLGDGIAFHLTENTIVSPVDGEVVVVANTKHAIGLKANNGCEILIHIGFNTVNCKGEGFKVFVENNQIVHKGDKLIEVDFEYFKSQGISLITPMVITNQVKVKINPENVNQVVAGETLIMKKN